MKTLFTLLVTFLMGFLNAYAGELFVRVQANGNFVARVYNQSQENGSQVYKFFDLPGGNAQLTIQNTYNNILLFSGWIPITNDERVVAEINQYGNLTIIQRSRIYVMNWYTTQVAGSNGGWGNGSWGGNQNDNWNAPNNGSWQGNQGMNNSNLNQFLTMLENEGMDSNRLTMAKNYCKSQGVSVNQLRQMMNKLTFDSNRLDLAKSAYSNCLDPGNYVLLKDAFTMTSNYNDLMKYVGGY